MSRSLTRRLFGASIAGSVGTVLLLLVCSFWCQLIVQWGSGMLCVGDGVVQFGYSRSALSRAAGFKILRWTTGFSFGRQTFAWRAGPGAFLLQVPVWALAGMTLAVAAGPLLLLRRRCGRSNRECTECGYDLTGNPTGRCPECGAELRIEPQPA